MRIHLNDENERDDCVYYYLSKKGHLPSLEFIDELKDKLKQHFSCELSAHNNEGKKQDDAEFVEESYSEVKNRVMSVEKAKKTKIRKFFVS